MYGVLVGGVGVVLCAVIGTLVLVMGVSRIRCGDVIQEVPAETWFV